MTYLPGGGAGGVLPSLTISTTSPVTGGGDLSANRIFAVNAFGAAQAGVVPLSGGGTANYLRADGSWVIPASVIADGDKGDITVSASGATWTIDNNTISTAKMGGDVTAAGKALLDDTDAAAQRTTLSLGTLATQSGTFSGASSGTNTGDQTSVSGNAGTATKLTIGHTVSLSGDVTYTSPPFDGTGDVTAAATVPGLTLKANLASPNLTGAPLAPTATVGTSTTQIATTAFVAASTPTLTTVEVDMGTGGLSSGYFTIPGAGWTPNKPVYIQQAKDVYTGKGVLTDEPEMDQIFVAAQVVDATTLGCSWWASGPIVNTIKYCYFVGA